MLGDKWERHTSDGFGLSNEMSHWTENLFKYTSSYEGEEYPSPQSRPADRFTGAYDVSV